MIHERVILTRCYADVAELADAPDLGSGVPDVQVQVLSSAGLETFHLNFIRVEGFFCLYCTWAVVLTKMKNSLFLFVKGYEYGILKIIGIFEGKVISFNPYIRKKWRKK